MTLKTPLFMQPGGADPAIPYSALDVRALIGMLWRTEGILPALSPGISALRVNQRASGANFSVDVGTGAALVNGDDAAGQGMYVVQSTATVNLVIPAPPGTGSRTHRVVAQVKDKLHNGIWSTYEWALEVLEDTGTGTPATPDSALSLATVAVAAGQSSVLDTHITDTRVTALLGPGRRSFVSSDAGRPSNPVTSEEIWRSDKGYFEIYNGTAWVPWVVTPPAPVQVSDGSTVTTSSNLFVAGSPVVSTTFVAPASGRVCVTVTAQVECLAPSSGYVSFQIHNGSTSAGSIFTSAASDNSVAVQEDHFAQASTRTLVTGLTGGATYFIQAMHRTSGASAMTAFMRRLLVEAA